MTTLGVINAMRKEHDQLCALLRDTREVSDGPFSAVEGMLGTTRVILTVSGIGKVNAAVGATELIRRYAPEAVLNTGVAGGVDTCLSVMDVVVGRRTVYHDVDCGPELQPGQLFDMPPHYEGDSRLLAAARSLTTRTPLKEGLICTGDQFITDRTQLTRIKERFPEALAVDMESCAIAQVCHLYGVPFLSFRIISDTPGVENHMDQYYNFWDEMADRSFGVTHALLEAVCR